MTPSSSATSARGALLGPAFAHALARGDFHQVADLLCPDIDFAAVTPRRAWEAQTVEDTLRVLRTWFDDATIVAEVVSVRADTMADRHSVTYRFAGERPQGSFVIEQHAYFAARGGQVGWMRLVCSGFRPRDAQPGTPSPA